jgi:hypothetical protein
MEILQESRKLTGCEVNLQVGNETRVDSSLIGSEY